MAIKSKGRTRSRRTVSAAPKRGLVVRKPPIWRRRWVWLVVAVAAVVTPSQDWFTMTALMLPLLIFYELSILVARLLKK